MAGNSKSSGGSIYVSSGSTSKKHPGFTRAEMEYLSSLDQSQLDSLIYQSRGLEDNKATKIATSSATMTGSWNQEQQIPANEQSALSMPVNVDDSNIEDYIGKLENKYLDPATLEARPDFADGSSPEKAIHKAIDGSAWARTKLAFTNKSPQEQVKYLENDFGAGNVTLSKGGNIAIRDKDTNAWYQLDPVGAGSGDWLDKAAEKTRDILADNADLAVSLGVGIATAGAAAPLAAGLSGLAAVGGAAGVGAASGAGSSMGRILMGRLMGTYDSTPEDTLKDIAVETLLGAAGNSFIPGVKYGAKEVGKLFIKSAPVLEQAAKASPEANSKLVKYVGLTSGQGEEMASHVVNNPKKVGEQMALYGGSDSAILNGFSKNVEQTGELAKRVVAARNKLGQELYGNFAKEAGEKFNPSVVRTFIGAPEEIGYDLVNKGILKFDNKTLQLSLNSVDDILAKNNVTGSVFADPEAAKVAKPILDVVNIWNKIPSAVGEEGGTQFIAFKKQLGAALQKSKKLANDLGMQPAFAEMTAFTDQLKSNYLNRSLDYVKNQPEVYQKLMSKLTAADSQYQQVKRVIKPFEDALRKDKFSAEGEAFKNLYESTLKQAKLSAKSSVVKSNLQKSLDFLGKYDSKMTEIVDDIGTRNAAIAFSSWTRGGLDTAFAAGAASSLNPVALISLAIRSPKINYHLARLATSAYNGLDFVRKLTPQMRLEMLKQPKAVEQLMNTITSIPGLEAQVGAQLGGQLNGQ